VCRRIVLTVLSLFALLLLAGAALVAYVYIDAYRAGPERRPDGAAGAPAPPPPGATGPEQTLERLERDFRGTPIGPGASAPNRFEVRITEQEANDLIHSLPEVRKALADFEIDDLRVYFEPGHLTATGRLPLVGGLRARLTLTGRIRAENGNLAYETVKVTAGGFPAPRQVRTELDKQLRQWIAELNRTFEGNVTEANVAEGVLVVRGVHAGR
jgi:hypothetical protein